MAALRGDPGGEATETASSRGRDSAVSAPTSIHQFAWVVPVLLRRRVAAYSPRVRASPPVNSRRIEALRALVERGATEGEREAARVALAAALGGEPEARGVPKPRRERAARASVCRWIRVADGWVITGPEQRLRSGLVTVHARDRGSREVLVGNVRNVEERWIADEVAPVEPVVEARSGRVRRPGQRPPPPYRRPDLLPEHYMQCWRLEDMLEELAGADVLGAVKARLQRTSLDDGQRRERLIAEIWRHQAVVDDAPRAAGARRRA